MNKSDIPAEVARLREEALSEGYTADHHRREGERLEREADELEAQLDQEDDE